MKPAILALLGMGAVAWSIDARADQDKKLGDPGTVAIGGQAGGGVSRDDAMGTMRTQQWGISGALIGDVFIAKNLSLGAVGAGTHFFTRGVSSTGSTKTNGNAAMVAARLGYYLPISERVGFWPVLQVGHEHQWSSIAYSDGFDDTTGPAVSWTGGLSAQILVHLSEHLYLRAVPGGLVARSTKVPRGTEHVHASSFSMGWNGMMMFGLGGWF